MSTLCIRGKNNIAVNVIDYARTHYEDLEILVIPDRTDDGIDRWQRSVKKYCKNNDIKIVTLKDVYDIPDLVFLSAEFDQIIKPNNFKSTELFNIHFSLLPKYKGLYTSVLPILNGNKETGVSLHLIRSGIDTGEIIDQVRLPISYEMSSFDLYSELINTGTYVVTKNLGNLLSGEYTYHRQDSHESSYYGKGYIDYKAIELDTNCTAEQIHNKVRAFAFRPYQLINHNGVDVIGSRITDIVSTKRPGIIISDNEFSMTMATIDYDIILYKDVLNTLNNAIQQHDNCKAKNLCVFSNIVNDKEENGWSPLTFAVYYNNMEMVKYLLSIGANETIIDNCGKTLLMHAANVGLKTGNWDIFRLLTKSEVSINQKDYNGKMLIDSIKHEQLNDIPSDVKNLIVPNQQSASNNKGGWIADRERFNSSRIKHRILKINESQLLTLPYCCGLEVVA